MSRSLAPDRTAFAQGPFAPEALPSFHATTGPCADPRASHLPFGNRLMGDVLAACAIHGWSREPSRFWPALLSWSATSSTPAVPRVHLTSSSPTTSAFTLAIQARLPASDSTNGFPWGCPFRRGRHSLCCGPPGCSPSWPFGNRSAAPEGFYIRAFRRFVTSSTVEYATRPTGRLPGLVSHQQEGQPFSAAHSRNKVEFSGVRAERYYLYRVYDFDPAMNSGAFYILRGAG